MTLTDREEIRDLLFTYCHLFDAGDFEAFADLFRHGSLNFFGEPMVGRESVLAFLRSRILLYGGKPRTQHLLSNTLVQVDPDRLTARAQSYLTVLQVVRGEGFAVILGARYLDELDRDRSGVWRFRSRTGVDGMMGDLSRHLRPEAAP